MVFVDNHHVSSFVAPDNKADYTITEYFAKSCPHCVRMDPVWKAAVSQALNTPAGQHVNWVQKECYSDNWAPGPDLKYCQSQGIEAFPTIKLVKNGSNQEWDAPPLTGATVSQKAEQLVKFVEAKTGDTVKVSSFDQGSLLASCSYTTMSEGQRFRNFL
jgi:hypothetical protein